MITEIPEVVLHDLQVGIAIVHFPYRRLQIIDQISLIDEHLPVEDAQKKIDEVHYRFCVQMNVKQDNHQGFAVKSKGRLLFVLFSDGFINVGLGHIVCVNI